jgi:hypothetical protein
MTSTIACGRLRSVSCHSVPRTAGEKALLLTVLTVEDRDDGPNAAHRLKGANREVCRKQAAAPETNSTSGVQSRGRRGVDQDLCALFAKRARALADPELAHHPPLIAAPGRGSTGRWLARAVLESLFSLQVVPSFPAPLAGSKPPGGRVLW